MKKILKWVGIIVGSLAVIGFLCFLYFIPPFTLLPPEEFINPTLAAGPSLEDIADPVERAIAERGKYLVTTLDCSGCHTPLGPEGPIWSEYLSGGNTSVFREHGAFVTRNLTSDKTTGLGRRTDVEVLRILRSGLLAEGRVAHNRDMPWGATSNWTEEDRYAVLTYLRHIKAVHRVIPDPDPNAKLEDPAASEGFY